MEISEERRDSLRVEVDCILICKAVGAMQSHEIACVDLSCSGISFYCGHQFQVGERAEVQILLECKVILKKNFFIKIVRSVSDEDGKFLIGAAIDYGDDDTFPSLGGTGLMA
jgi:hypothetical protein